MEITAGIFLQKDDGTEHRLVDYILDVAGQKGTGIWTSQAGMELKMPVPTIDMAVSMRAMSELKKEREAAAEILAGPAQTLREDRKAFTDRLKNALYAAWIVTFSQGMALLRQASIHYDYSLNLETVTRIWRGGCIIRSALLDTIMASFQKNPDLSNLLLDPELGGRVTERQSDLRHIIATAAAWGITPRTPSEW